MGSLATFKIQEEVFGIDILLTKEIGKIGEITNVPQAPSYLTGLMNLRGQILSLVRPSILMGKKTKEIDEDSRVIILKTKEQVEELIKRGLISETRVGADSMALIVDELGDVIDYSSKDLQEVPPHIEEKYRELFSGVVQNKEDLVVVVNLEKLFEKIGLDNINSDAL